MAKLGKIGKSIGTGLKKTGKSIGNAAGKAGRTAKTGVQKSTKKLDNLAGVVDGKKNKAGKTVSKGRQRLGKLGEVVEKAPEVIEGINTIKNTFTSNNDGGGGNPQPMSTQKDTKKRESVDKPTQNMATKNVQQGAKTLMNENKAQPENNKPGRQAYLNALNTVNQYESAGCSKPSSKPKQRAHF